jgi:hypothetical protein
VLPHNLSTIDSLGRLGRVGHVPAGWEEDEKVQVEMCKKGDGGDGQLAADSMKQRW